MDESQMIADMEPTIRHFCRRWGRHKEDIAQDVRMQLFVALRTRWNPALGQWSTYARWRIPRMVIDAARRMRLIDKQKRQLPRQVSLSVIQDNEVDPEPGNRVSALDADPLSDLGFSEVDVRDLLERFASDRQFRVLAAFVERRTMKAAGEQLGVCEQRVGQLIKNIKRSPEARRRFLKLAGLDPWALWNTRPNKPSARECVMGLALTRTVDQGIRIGDTVRVKVIKVKGKAIRLLIDAPRDVRIVREEIAMKPGGESLQPTPTPAGFVSNCRGGKRGKRFWTRLLRDGRVAEAIVSDAGEIFLAIEGQPLRELKLEALCEALAQPA